MEFWHFMVHTVLISQSCTEVCPFRATVETMQSNLLGPTVEDQCLQKLVKSVTGFL